MDHVSIHIEDTKSSKEVIQPDNRDLGVVIKDLQHSQATIWEKFQSLRQRTATPQTPQGGQGT